MEDLVDKALANLQPALGADGARLVLEAADGNVLRLRLCPSGPEACADCVVETETMEEIVLAALHDIGAPYTTVHITDELDRSKGL